MVMRGMEGGMDGVYEHFGDLRMRMAGKRCSSRWTVEVSSPT